MEFTAKDIANLIGGKVDGNPEAKVNKLAKIDPQQVERQKQAETLRRQRLEVVDVGAPVTLRVKVKVESPIPRLVLGYMIKDRLGANPLVLQLPIGSESDFIGLVDLVRMQAMVWRGETKIGEDYVLEAIPADLQDQAGLLEDVEALELRLDRVGANGEVGEDELPALAADRESPVLNEAKVRIGELDAKSAK